MLRMPDLARAPAYRSSLAGMSHFRVDDLGGGVVAVAPAEGAGTVAEHLKLIKVCDASSDFGDPVVWEAIRAHPPRQRTDIEDPLAYRERMVARGRDIVEKRPSTESEIVAFALSALGAAEAGDMPDLLAATIPGLLDRFPAGSLWLVTISDVLLNRLAFGRTQLALQLTPDLPIGPEMEQLRSFEAMTLTRGIDFGELVDLALLAFSPGVLGLRVPAMPHSLVFCFGAAVDLRRPYPTSFASLYRPRVLNDAEGLDRSVFFQHERPDDGERLLGWWIARLNVIYSHATDPTRFTDDQGFYDAAAQTAWTITVERLMGDAMSLLSEPQATELDRVQVAFDLLDKAESLMGYGKDESGDGFQALLRRTKAVRRAREALSSLPEDLRARLGDEIVRLFDDLRDAIRLNTLTYRLTPRGARVASKDAADVEAISDDDLIARGCPVARRT
jgi:hypothetical protein